MSNGRGAASGGSWTGTFRRVRPQSDFKLVDGSRVGVIGGGPAGSMFSYFLQQMAEMVGLELEVDLYEPNDYVQPQPVACNMCGGIVSETLVQHLSTDGISLPPDVIQRGIEAYVLHMDGRRVRIEAPLQEKRIGSVHRGTGPRKLDPVLKLWKSFDGHLQQLATTSGVRPIRERVAAVDWEGGTPHLSAKNGEPNGYDLVAVAVGINSPALKLFEGPPVSYRAPTAVKTFIREYFMAERDIERHLGNSMHVFLLNIPGIEFAAIIPKLNCATVCLLGDDIDKDVFQSFLDSPEVRSVMPESWDPGEFACHCSPKMNVGGATRPYGDRIVFIGDSGVTRLYKDGIGAAYRTAKAAARTAVFSGVSAADFERHYGPVCRRIAADNRLGRLVFAVAGEIQKHRAGRESVLRMVMAEQADRRRPARMSTVMWDMFTGSATYSEIFRRTLHPAFQLRQLGAIAASILRRPIGTHEASVASAPVVVGGDGGQG
jgi:flavin-dependent dehydrogenase